MRKIKVAWIAMIFCFLNVFSAFAEAGLLRFEVRDSAYEMTSKESGSDLPTHTDCHSEDSGQPHFCHFGHCAYVVQLSNDCDPYTAVSVRGEEGVFLNLEKSSVFVFRPPRAS